jgi:hypothetical protein
MPAKWMLDRLHAGDAQFGTAQITIDDAQHLILNLISDNTDVSTNK